jgi:hypothetical protein
MHNPKIPTVNDAARVSPEIDERCRYCGGGAAEVEQKRPHQLCLGCGHVVERRP